MRCAEKHELTSKLIRVVHLGPGPEEYGGIPTVISQILNLNMPGIENICVSTHTDKTPLAKIVIAIRAALTLVRFGKSIDIAHIHVSFGSSVWRKMVFCVLLKVAGVSYIIHAHGSDFREFWENCGFLRRGCIRSWFNRAARVVVLSSDWEKFYSVEVGAPTKNIRTIPNTVSVKPLGRKDELSRDRIVNLVFLGRLGHRKGAWDLLAAFKESSRSSKCDLRLLLAGDGDVDGAREWVKANGLSEVVDVPGWLGADDRHAALASGDVFVLPSYREGLPVAILEAQSYGLPVISTAIGSIPDVVTSGVHGLLVQPGDIPSIAKSILELSENPELRRSMGLAGYRRVLSENSEEEFSGKLQHLYKEVITKSS